MTRFEVCQRPFDGFINLLRWKGIEASDNVTFMPMNSTQSLELTAISEKSKKPHCYPDRQIRPVDPSKPSRLFMIVIATLNLLDDRSIYLQYIHGKGDKAIF